jgi:LPS export ABC transporter protein LptC
MIKSVFILFGIAIAISLAGRYLFSVEKEYTSQLINEPEQLYYSHQFKGFSLTNTNIEGTAQSVIHSPSTRVMTQENKTFMDDPKLIMYREEEAPIVITANHAVVLHADNQTLLKRNVKVTMPNNSNNNIVMTTEQLTLNNHDQTAKTDLPATIIHGKGNMHGTGLEFNPNTKQIKFLNKVRGIYEQ